MNDPTSHPTLQQAVPSADAASPLAQRALAAAHLFVRPRRRSADAAPAAAPARALALPSGDLRYWAEGEGEPVLLVHGWEGATTDLAGMAQALRARGQAVVWVELPAHGASAVGWTSVPHAAQALSALGSALGRLRGVIAHSVGGALAALAMADRLQVRRAALIGAPAEYRDYVHRFAQQTGLGAEGGQALSDALREQYGIDADRVSTAAAARGLDVPALLIHSRDDPVVPFADAEVIAAAWPGARLLSVDGLGHRRTLSDPAVVAAAVGHVCA
ncbi:MAG: alpha/beta fold hydrolase [Pseudomonadota bacterium]